MRAKLSVQFHGEEGIDAGGVSREWYSVMAREIFNPNISLFIPLPEGGTTFQPNPNSVVQNDEVRGTSHLDFFKFVGRVVGKALYDGQFIDAYFTRSYYKHMLNQPLTYQVRFDGPFWIPARIMTGIWESLRRLHFLLVTNAESNLSEHYKL